MLRNIDDSTLDLIGCTLHNPRVVRSVVICMLDRFRSEYGAYPKSPIPISLPKTISLYEGLLRKLEEEIAQE